MSFTIYDMSRGIVNQRPYSQKKRKQTFRKMLNRSGVSIPEFQISKKIKNILSRWLWFTIFVVVWILILLKILFFQPWQVITQVKFSDDTIATYQDIELFNMISDEVKWKNYYMILSDKDNLLSKIRTKFPFVWKIELQLEPPQEQENLQIEDLTIWIHLPEELNWTWYSILTNHFPLRPSAIKETNWWTLWIQLMYYDPLVLVQINDKQFAIWDESTYVEIKEWMLIWVRNPDEEPLFLIETPQYLTWTNVLNWFFQEISLSEFMQLISLAKDEFWYDMLRFVYLAWSTRFAIFTSDQKTIYFNFPEWEDIQQQRENQILKYHILKEMYDKFWNVDKIDLWALENNKVIIKNY